MEKLIYLNGVYVDRETNTAEELANSYNAAIAAVWSYRDSLYGDCEEVKLINKDIKYHRQPTPSEIRFGYGATHYKDFSVETYRKDNGYIKKWLVCPHDGLRYYS